MAASLLMVKSLMLNFGSRGKALRGRNILFQYLPLTFFRMRAQAIIEALPAIAVPETEGPMIPLMKEEVEHCAAVIAAAYLNPCKLIV
jgi:hypothetical protein